MTCFKFNLLDLQTLCKGKGYEATISGDTMVAHLYHDGVWQYSVRLA